MKGRLRMAAGRLLVDDRWKTGGPHRKDPTGRTPQQEDPTTGGPHNRGTPQQGDPTTGGPHNKGTPQQEDPTTGRPHNRGTPQQGAHVAAVCGWPTAVVCGWFAPGSHVPDGRRGKLGWIRSCARWPGFDPFWSAARPWSCGSPVSARLPTWTIVHSAKKRGHAHTETGGGRVRERARKHCFFPLSSLVSRGL